MLLLLESTGGWLLVHTIVSQNYKVGPVTSYKYGYKSAYMGYNLSWPMYNAIYRDYNLIGYN